MNVYFVLYFLISDSLWMTVNEAQPDFYIYVLNILKKVILLQFCFIKIKLFLV